MRMVKNPRASSFLRRPGSLSSSTTTPSKCCSYARPICCPVCSKHSPSANQSSNNPLLTSYDIVAVQPGTDSLFLKCCQSPDIDIISFDMTQRLPFKLKHNIVTQAIDKGIYFEVCLSQLLKDALARRIFISNVTDLVRVTRGKGILFTSGATSPLHLRAPYDFVNLYVLDCFPCVQTFFRRIEQQFVTAAAPSSASRPLRQRRVSPYILDQSLSMRVRYYFLRVGFFGLTWFPPW